MAKAGRRDCMCNLRFSTRIWKSQKGRATNGSGLDHPPALCQGKKNTEVKTVQLKALLTGRSSQSKLWTHFTLAAICRDYRVPGREMHQFDRERLEGKENRKDIRKSKLGTGQEHGADCSRLSSVTVLVDMPKRRALHFPNWFSFEMTNGSTCPRNCKQLPGASSSEAQQLVSQWRQSGAREKSWEIPAGHAAPLDAIHLSLPNPQDLHRAVHIKWTPQAGKAWLKCKLRVNTLQHQRTLDGCSSTNYYFRIQLRSALKPALWKN